MSSKHKPRQNPKTLKRKAREYNSDSSQEEMDAKDLDLLTNDDAFSMDSFSDDDRAEVAELKAPKDKAPLKTSEEMQSQRNLKLSNVISKLLHNDADNKVHSASSSVPYSQRRSILKLNLTIQNWLIKQRNCWPPKRRQRVMSDAACPITLPPSMKNNYGNWQPRAVHTY